jgi:hypothetical protein
MPVTNGPHSSHMIIATSHSPISLKGYIPLVQMFIIVVIGPNHIALFYDFWKGLVVGMVCYKFV